MTKTLAALLVLAAMAAAAGCGDQDTNAPAATTTPVPATATAAASTTPAPATTPVAVPAGGLRAQTCADFLPMLDEIRKHDEAAARTTAETTITNLPQTPEWSTLSEADRAATVAGIRDAAAGTCQ